jgi:hypothetical protein
MRVGALGFISYIYLFMPALTSRIALPGGAFRLFHVNYTSISPDKQNSQQPPAQQVACKNPIGVKEVAVL